MPRIDKSSSMPMTVLETQFIPSGAIKHSGDPAIERIKASIPGLSMRAKCVC